jgi:chaperonin GroES
MSKLPRPLRDYVLARPVEAEKKTASGIIIPDSATEKSEDAVVKAVGKDVKEVKVNDVISYKAYSTIEKKVGNDKYILVREEDIAAVN